MTRVKQKFTPVFVVSPDAHNYSYVNLDYYSSDNLGSLDWTNVSDILGRDEDGDGVDGNWGPRGQTPVSISGHTLRRIHSRKT